MLTKDGSMFVNGKKITEDRLVPELLALKPSLEKKEVVVKADESAKSREIMKIMQAAQSAEFEKLIVAGEPLSKKEQKKLEQTSSRNRLQEIPSEE